MHPSSLGKPVNFFFVQLSPGGRGKTQALHHTHRTVNIKENPIVGQVFTERIQRFGYQFFIGLAGNNASRNCVTAQGREPFGAFSVNLIGRQKWVVGKNFLTTANTKRLFGGLCR